MPVKPVSTILFLLLLSSLGMGQITEQSTAGDHVSAEVERPWYNDYRLYCLENVSIGSNTCDSAVKLFLRDLPQSVNEVWAGLDAWLRSPYLF